MDLGFIIKDSIKYPISDTNKFFKLALPAIVVAAIFAIAELLAFISGSNSINDPLTMIIGVLGLISFLLFFIVAITYSGLMINIIRYNINGQEVLPDLEIGKFLLDGLKSIIVSFIYMIVPTFIIMIISALFLSIELESIAMIFILLLCVILFIISLLMPAIYGKLAETNSISNALNVTQIWNITKEIGFASVFVTVLVLSLIASVISLIMFICLIIPVIGPILIAVILAYYMMVYSRAYSLLYNTRNQNNMINQGYSNNQYNQNNYSQYQQNNYDQYNQNNYNQYNPENQMSQENDIPQNNDISQNNDIPKENTNSQPKNNLDFQRPNTQNNNTQQNNKQVEVCPNCGTENRLGAKFCMTCGEEL